MTQENCPICGTPNDVNNSSLKRYVSQGQIDQCEGCGFPLSFWIHYEKPRADVVEAVLQWSKSQWGEIDQLKNELLNKKGKIDHLQRELDSARVQPDNKNLDPQGYDSEIEETALEVNTENIENLWEQLEPHFTSYVKQEIQECVKQETQELQNALEKLRSDLEAMKKDIKKDKDIEARFKEENQTELPDQTLSDHDSSGSETSSETLSSTGQDGMDMNRNTSSSVTSSSGDSQSHSWSWLSESKPDDVTVVSPDNIEELRSKLDVPMIFTQQNNGSYWIVRDPSSSRLYLIPHKKTRFIDVNSVMIREKIFECQNYDENWKQKKLKIVKPAIVKQLEREEKWAIQEKGELIFISKT